MGCAAESYYGVALLRYKNQPGTGPDRDPQPKAVEALSELINEKPLKMASKPPSHTTVSSSSTPLARLHNIANHMSSPAVTSFPPEAVPQAPEDPLFGLSRAYKADESPNKVDLVRPCYPMVIMSSPFANISFFFFRRASAHTETTMESRGFYQS